jgi:hypothetical protein
VSVSAGLRPFATSPVDEGGRRDAHPRRRSDEGEVGGVGLGGGGCPTVLGGWGRNWKIRLEPAPAAGECGDGCRPAVVGSSGSVWSMVKRGETHGCNAGLYAVVFFFSDMRCALP